MQSGDKGLDAQPLSESDKRRLSKYGTLPRGGLLAQQSKKRTYFDSGDFALSAAHRVTGNGAIQTGTMHPRRDSISHPFSPVPAASNADKDANEDSQRGSASSQKSQLDQQTNVEDKDPTNDEGLDDHISH